MKLWLDDERDPKGYKGWEDATWVTTPEEAIVLLDTNLVTSISLDNDLGLPEDQDGRQRDGYSVAEWIENRVETDDLFMPPVVLNAHTANPVSAKRMEAAFRAIRTAMAMR